MSTISEAIASNTTADVYVFNNTRYIITDEPTPSWAVELIESMQATNVNLQATNANLQALIDEIDQHDHENENLESLEEPMPSWARELSESMQALIDIIDRDNNRTENLESLEEPMPSWARTLLEDIQDLDIKLDQHDIRLKNLESLDESDSLEDNSPQIEIPKEPINDHLDSYNVVPSNDYYPKDMTDYEYNEVKVDIPMFVEVDDPKEYLNEDMTSSLPKTTQFINPTPRSNSTIRCFKCRKIGHVKADCSNLIIVMDDSNLPPTNDSKKFELEDEMYDLDKAMSIKHVHIIHDIVLKEFASSYKRYKTFIAFPRRYKILKPSDLVDTKIHPPKLLKFSFKFQLKNYVPFKLLLKLIHIFGIIFMGAYLVHLLFQI